MFSDLHIYLQRDCKPDLMGALSPRSLQSYWERFTLDSMEEEREQKAAHLQSSPWDNFSLRDDLRARLVEMGLILGMPGGADLQWTRLRARGRG